MCAGGDLKFHLRAEKDKLFSLERAQFYASEVLLGLEHIHSHRIVYRDLKPSNILLDESGHIKISDLGLTIKLRKNKTLKHLAGTAGYWAPEIVCKTGTYPASDFWSFGVFIYEMLTSKRPRCQCKKKTKEWCPFGQSISMEENAQSGNGILKLDIEYPQDKINPVTKDLLQRLFIVDPFKRLGANGANDIKNHPFFATINWNTLKNLDVSPPYKPDSGKVNADSIDALGEFPRSKLKKIKLTPEDEQIYLNFPYKNDTWVQQELVTGLKKHEIPSPSPLKTEKPNEGCCLIL